MYKITREAHRGRRSLVIRSSLAALAFLGIGLGVTTAVWTDDVWFSSGVTTKTFNLQGSATSATAGFEESGTEGSISLAIPTGVWAGMEPGDSVTTSVWLKNAGTAPAVMTTPVFTLNNASNGLTITGTGTGLSVTASGIDTGDVLNAGAVRKVDVTITAGGDLVQGASGTLRMQIHGESQA